MHHRSTENPALSPMTHLSAVEYPVEREQLVRGAADNDAPADVINLLNALPKERYESKEEAMRDFAEAARRFGMGNQSADDGIARDRRNIGRDLVENPPKGMNRHP